MALPKPPIRNMTDFVVFCFVSVVVLILMIATVGLFIDSFVDPEGDRSTLVNALADIVTTLIGALVGFIAGKGTGHQEAREIQDEKERRLHDEEEAKKS